MLHAAQRYNYLKEILFEKIKWRLYCLLNKSKLQHSTSKHAICLNYPISSGWSFPTNNIFQCQAINSVILIDKLYNFYQGRKMIFYSKKGFYHVIWQKYGYNTQNSLKTCINGSKKLTKCRAKRWFFLPCISNDVFALHPYLAILLLGVAKIRSQPLRVKQNT